MFKKCFKTLSSLEKVFIDKIPVAEEFKSAAILKNQRFSFQIAYTGLDLWERQEFSFEIKSELSEFITARKTGYVPSEMPLWADVRDDYILNEGKPGLYPDPLYPLDKNIVVAKKDMFDSLWITLDTDGKAPAGTYTIEVVFTHGEDVCTKKVTVEILDAMLPEQSLMFTQWFYGDCIASYYNIDVFSEKHWDYLDKFIATAARNGINMLLTPIFTPPLDTVIGGERPTIQLVDVKCDNGKYSFNFDKLGRWFDICLKNGIKYFEMAHLFTQWGALNCPKIMAEVNGEYKRIFGWDTSSVGEEYRTFLSEFLPALTGYIESRSLKDVTYFHISDEPHVDQIEMYLEAKKGAEKYLEGYNIIDALSGVEFFKTGVIKMPVPALKVTEEFIEAGMNPRWTYYCCGQNDKLSNRFFAYPSWRTAILGTQMFKYDISGFLQWGYNFYYSEHSKFKINPYLTTDADRAFPSGDAFSVYPGDGCCIESLRIVVFHEGIQDMRALEFLAGYIGRDAVNAIIDEVAGTNLTFEDYPAGSYFLLALRRRVAQEIKKYI